MPKKGGHNVSVYIIVCSRRIRDLATGNSDPHVLRLVNASDAAVAVVSQLELLNPKQPIEAGEITDLQHYIMDHLLEMNSTEAAQRVAEMFYLLDKLEDSLE